MSSLKVLLFSRFFIAYNQNLCNESSKIHAEKLESSFVANNYCMYIVQCTCTVYHNNVWCFQLVAQSCNNLCKTIDRIIKNMLLMPFTAVFQWTRPSNKHINKCIQMCTCTFESKKSAELLIWADRSTVFNLGHLINCC